MTIETLIAEIASRGLAWRGAFHPSAEDGVPLLPGGRPAATLVLVGFVGPRQWPGFATSAEAQDGAPHPLDRWSRRLINAMAGARGGIGLDPSDGPPWHPFQRWARRAESVHPSPLGVLIHPRWGLWHAYRGAMALPTRLALAAVEPVASPCQSCAGRPCLSTCPVDAIRPAHYDVDACRRHVTSAAGRDCLELGCRARRACPVGVDERYGPAQATFHMRAFVR